MKFRRWKKLLVMLLITSMFLQNVGVYAYAEQGPPVTEQTPADTTDTEHTEDAAAAPDTSTDPLTTPEADEEDEDGTPSETPDKPETTEAPEAPEAPETPEAPDNAPAGTTNTELAGGATVTPGTAPDASDNKPDASADTLTTPEEDEEGEETDGEKSEDLDEETDDEESEESSETDPVKEEVPAEVQKFLDAVAKLPAAEEVTAENAEAIGEQVNAVFNMAEALDDDLYLSEEVQAALNNTVYVLMEAVLAAEEIDESNTYDDRTSNVTRSPYEDYAPNKTNGPDLSVYSNGMVPDKTGAVTLTGNQNTATDYLQVRYYTNHGGA